jgi:hypothetical protein
MMGGVSPETCYDLYKHGVINFDKLFHLGGYVCMKDITSYYFSRLHITSDETTWEL